MVRLNKVLDPTLTGRDAEDLEAGLRRKIVGQDEAIEVDIALSPKEIVDKVLQEVKTR